MPTRPSNSAIQLPQKKTAITTRTVQAAAADSACQTENDAAAQIVSLRMLLLHLKAALIPPTTQSIRHEDTEEQLKDLANQMKSAASLVPDAVELLHQIELACCISRQYKTKLHQDAWLSVCQSLSRDDLDSMQLTSRRFKGLISGTKPLSLRPLTSMKVDYTEHVGDSSDDR